VGYTLLSAYTDHTWILIMNAECITHQD